LINIDDRIVYSGSFGNGGDPELTQIFGDAGLQVLDPLSML